MKKRILSIVSVLLVTVMLIGAVPFVSAAAETATAGENPFTDISKNWAKGDILWAYENGIATGTSATTFSPSGSLSRGMFVCFLARLANLAGEDVTDYPEANPFADIKNTSKHWYYSAAAWAFDKGIVSGTAVKDGKAVFSPNNDITRQETASIFYRFMSYLGCKIGTDGAKTFPDGSKIQKWARESATALTAVGVFAGDAKGCFNPSGKADRATAVSLCRRIYNLITPAEENASEIPYVSYSPLNYNTDDLSDVSFRIGRVRFTATLTDGAKVLLKAPKAAEDELKEINAVDYFEIDGKEHTYDAAWLDNNAVVFFCDGERVNVFGRERTYDEELDAKLYKTTVQYQNPTCDAPEVTVAFENIEVKNPTVYRAIDRSPLALHGALATSGRNLVDKNGKTVMLAGAALGVFGTMSIEGCYPNNDCTQDQFFTTYEELKWMRDDWGVNLIRISVIPGDAEYNCWGKPYPRYVDATGEDRAKYDENISKVIENAKKIGMYVLLDWHGYEEVANDVEGLSGQGDVRLYQNEALEFFGRYAKKYADYDNMLFDLYNEPSNLNWRWGHIDDETGEMTTKPEPDVVNYFRCNERFLTYVKKVAGAEPATEEDLQYWVARYTGTAQNYRILAADGKRSVTYTMLPGDEYAFSAVLKPYSEKMIAEIRKYDPDAVCVIPTPSADQHPEAGAIDPLDCGNVMYAFHSSSFGISDQITTRVTTMIERLDIPCFLSEYGFYPQGTMEADGVEVTYENAKLYGDAYRDWLVTFVEGHGVSNSGWRYLRSRRSDDFYENYVDNTTCPLDLRSGWTYDMLTFHGQMMHDWWGSLREKGILD